MFEKHAVEIDTLFKRGNSFYNTVDEIVIAGFYPLFPDISIDYAILEKVNSMFTIPANIGWSNLGTWASLHAISEKDKFRNPISCGVANIYDTLNCIIQLPKDKAAVIKGLDNYIIVDDGKVLLIYPRQKTGN